MRLKDFLLKEEKERHAVLAFGRMNPLTTGHELLVNKVKEVSNKHKASAFIVLSHSQDKAKNPLSPAQKLKHARRFFPAMNFSVASSKEPNFLTQAARLYKKGFDHLHMVAGSDRVPEFKRLLEKYNGTKEGDLFNFKSIDVVSAGERDPDAEGTTGMSASKMRSYAAEGNYKEFKKGVPSHVIERHARELYDDVRRGMGIRETVNEQVQLDNLFEQFLTEGVHDKGIFKAVFLSGGPGSGKDYVLDKTLQGHGLTEINSDKAFEYLMDKENLDMKMPESEKEIRELVRGRAKNITDLRERLAMFGRNGLIINGTGDDINKISKIKKRLEDLGYETSMIAVVTDDEVSRQRNIERGRRGGRTVPEEIRKEKWDSVTAARPKMAEMFGDKYVEFDNSHDSHTAPPEVVEVKQKEMLKLFKTVKDFVSKPPENEKAQQWVASELSKRDTLGVPKTGQGIEKTAQPTAPAVSGEQKPKGDLESEAQRLGLQYYGFGRYGKDGKVTHHSVHGKLVQDPVHQEQQKLAVKATKPVAGTPTPQKPKQQIKNKPTPKPVNVKEDVDSLFENFLNEAVTISITADTPEDATRTVQLLIGDEPEELKDDTSTPIFSDDTARKLLQLSKMGVEEYILPEPTSGISIEETKVTEPRKKDEHEAVYLKGVNGKDRIFILRKSAAKEAHIRNGEVEKCEKCYRVKLKENCNVSKIDQLVEESIYKELLTESEGSSCGRTTRQTENYTDAGSKLQTNCKKTQIDLNSIKSKFKQSLNEIDQGTEVGISMSGGGENATRGGLSTRPKKRPFDENIGDGGEMASSMSDEKEDKLKKQGISLSTFRGRNCQ